jgi:hypothetical protein
MRGNRAILVFSLIGLSAVLGCKSEPKLKPPSHPEELIIPSMADARFSTPDYPKAAFKTNNDIKKESDELPGMAGRPMSGPTRMAAGGGMPY